MLDDRLDCAFNFVERLRVRVLLVIQTDNVKTVAALYEIADLALGKRKSDFLEFRNGLAAADPVQGSALLRTTGIFRILLRDLFEVRPALHLLQQVFGTALCFCRAFLVNLAVRSRKRCLDQDMADLYLLGHAVLITMLIVVGSQVVLCHLKASFQLVGIDQCILYLALLGNGVGVRGLVALVISLQLRVGWMQVLLDLILLQHSVLKLDLRVLLYKLLVDL